MAPAILNAIVSILSKNPVLLESIVEGLLQLIAQEIQKAVAAAQSK